LLGYDVPSVLSSIVTWSDLQPFSIACNDVHFKLLVSYHLSMLQRGSCKKSFSIIRWVVA